MKLRTLFASLVVLGLAFGTARAQESAASELLQRVPDDLGLCFVIHDLRGQLERWNKTPWVAKLKENPLVKGFFDRQEFGDLMRLEEALKEHLKFDFAFVRDEVLGEGVVFAYQPPPSGGAANDEKGLLLIKARKAEALATVIEKFNELQTNSGELTSIEDRKHKGQVYYRRVHQRATHFYFVKGPFLAAANKEDVIHAVIDRMALTTSPRRELWAKAGLTKAAATLCINPRIFDDELVLQAKSKKGPEAALFQTVLGFWKGLDGLYVSLQGDDVPEARLTLLARPGSDIAKLWGTPSTSAPQLWSRFSENALISSTIPIDFAKTLKTLQEYMPEKDARNLDFFVQKNLGAATGLDVANEVLPNLGPDVGFVLTMPEGNGLPRALFALGVKSAPADSPVDQILLKAANLFIGLAVFDHNRKSSDIIRVRTVQQGSVEVKYLSSDKLFPPGVQPAYALKDGYLLFASTPDAIASFRIGNSAVMVGDEIPLIKIAPREWSRLMKMHRASLIDHLVAKNNETAEAAANLVDGLAAGFDVFQSLTLTQRVGSGQAALILRLTPAK